MTETAHAIVAGAIAAKFNDPIIAPTLAFTSHFVMDTIPHWDFGTDWRERTKQKTALLALIDTGIGFLLAYILYRSKVSLPLLLLTVSFSMLPDWINALWYMFFASQTKTKPKQDATLSEKGVFKVYQFLHFFHARSSPFIGIVTTLVTVLFFVLLLS